MGPETAFVDLRRLADWFMCAGRTSAAGGQRPSIDRVVRRLGTRCVPLLGRELCSPIAARRDAARDALAELAKEPSARDRVLIELRRIAAAPKTDTSDEAKVAAVGLLAEHGERRAARFSDPSAIQRRSALALAASLDNEADIASAADLMIRQMSPLEIIHLIEVMVEASRGAAYHLAVELCARLDLDEESRDRIAEIALGGSAPLPVVRGAPRPTHVAVLVDPSQRVVVVASRKTSIRRWRRWAVLIGAHGAIDDCVHDERSGVNANDADHGPLIARLVADGYVIAGTDLERARGIVAAAARQTATSSAGESVTHPSTVSLATATPLRPMTTVPTSPRPSLTSAYYLGRDLLDLGEAHLGGRAHAHPTSTTLGRAVELIADGDIPRAQVLLARCAETADSAAATASCLLAQNRVADALPYLLAAAQLEPEFPLHHYNLAAVLHHLGDPQSLAACYAALRRFLLLSEQPTGLYADPDQPARVSLAARLCAELERTARLTGIKLDIGGGSGSRRKRRTAKRADAKR